MDHIIALINHVLSTTFMSHLTHYSADGEYVEMWQFDGYEDIGCSLEDNMIVQVIPFTNAQHQHSVRVLVDMGDSSEELTCPTHQWAEEYGEYFKQKMKASSWAC